ncbi:MAG: DUF99 family protein [Nanoarchaeota archaeon]|nr:DUF99 family protein [Nanoarchaeota archaeon]
MPKEEIRVLGIDDTPFDKFKDKRAKIIGVLYRGGKFLDGVLSVDVDVDGTDATAKIASMVNNSKFKEQLRAILMKGIAVAGFNIIDIHELSEKTCLPVIVVMRSPPRLKEMVSALKRLGYTEQLESLEKAGKINNAGKVLFQCAGCTEDKAASIIEVTTTHGNIPEPLRVAHLIAGGITKGESRGRA